MNTMNTKENILIVDDDTGIRLALRHSLVALGYRTEEAGSGEQAIALTRAQHYDAVLLDANMRGMSGVETCRTVRRESPTSGILMLTVRADVDDRVEALDAGADDYITKPFVMGELVARLRAVKRGREDARRTADLIVIGDISLDPDKHLVTRRGAPLRLTPREFELLAYFMRNAGRPLRHQTVLRDIWGPDFGGELEYLRTFVRQLRRKIEDTPSQPCYLTTENHIGYRFRSAA